MIIVLRTSYRCLQIYTCFKIQEFNVCFSVLFNIYEFKNKRKSYLRRCTKLIFDKIYLFEFIFIFKFLRNMPLINIDVCFQVTYNNRVHYPENIRHQIHFFHYSKVKNINIFYIM